MSTTNSLIKTDELRYRIVKEANLAGDAAFYVETYKKTGKIFKTRKWVFEKECKRYCGGEFFDWIPRKFATLEDATNHVNKLVRKLQIVQEGTIEIDRMVKNNG